MRPVRPSVIRMVGIFGFPLMLLLWVAYQPVYSPVTATQPLATSTKQPTLPTSTIQPAASGVDLSFTMTVSPENPAPGEEVIVEVAIANSGTEDMAFGAGYFVYFYVLEADTGPPTADMEPMHYTRLLGMNVGQSTTYTRTNDDWFPESGAYDVWIWVDPLDDIAEADEDNNLSFTRVIAEHCLADPYEADNGCTQAVPLDVDVPQEHTLCSTDEDWYSFVGTGGTTYEVVTERTNDDATIALELRSACGDDVPASYIDTDTLQFTVPTSDTYYIRALDDAMEQTIKTTYTITLTSLFTCADDNEPNDAPITANTILPDGTSERHSVCKINDEDWMKFDAEAGQRYVVNLDDPAGDAHIDVYQQTPDGIFVWVDPERILSPSDTTFYVRAQSNGTTGTDFSVSVAESHTLGDVGERVEAEELGEDGRDKFDSNGANDTSMGNANPVAVNAEAVLHTIMPKNDEDWIAFEATANERYTIESNGIETYGDVVVCLYNSAGNMIQCDDDGGNNFGGRIADWQAPASGTYYVQVCHVSQGCQYGAANRTEGSVAGYDTLYKLAVIQGSCPQDTYEPDNTFQQAKPLSVDANAAPQTHNLCQTVAPGKGDRDWNTVAIPTAGCYAFETGEPDRGNDTVLILYDTDGQTELTRNDDYGAIQFSKLVWQFDAPGTYYLETRHFNPSTYGLGTTYHLSAKPSECTLPTPTPVPTIVSPTYVPDVPNVPDSELLTVIVANRTRMEHLYGKTNTDEIFNWLSVLANDDRVKGTILEVDKTPSVKQAYDEWVAVETQNTLDSIQKANHVTEEIHKVLHHYLQLGNIQYVVLVGNDRVIPFHRVKSHEGRGSEQKYSDIILEEVKNTSVGVAIAQNHYLTDDFYGRVHMHGALIPDKAIGRLIEEPDQIGGMIQTFTESPGNLPIAEQRPLAVGYHVMTDVAASIGKLFKANITDKTDSTLIGDDWNGEQLKAKQINANPPFLLQSINTHADHEHQSFPNRAEGERGISANDIREGSSDLSRGIVYTPGCHAGLHVPNATEKRTPDDLPQAYADKRVHYIGNTGYGLGCGVSIAFSEEFVKLYTEALLKGPSMSIGEALKEAKRKYHNIHRNDFDAVDAKIIQQFVLYGLPMHAIITNDTLDDDDPFPDVQRTAIEPPNSLGPDDAIVTRTLKIDVQGATGLQAAGVCGSTGFEERQAGEMGTFCLLDGHTDARADKPVLPLFYEELPAGSSLRNVSFVGGTFITATVDPVINTAVELSLEQEHSPLPEESPFQSKGFYPPVPFTVARNAGDADDRATLSVVMGQYDSASGVQRIYTSLEYEITYATLSADSNAPPVDYVQGYYDSVAQEAVFKVAAEYGARNLPVQVMYTTPDGNAGTLKLAYDQEKARWLGSTTDIPPGSQYYILAQDDAGNTTKRLQKPGDVSYNTAFTLRSGAFISSDTTEPTPTNTPTAIPTESPDINPTITVTNTPTNGDAYGLHVYLPLITRK